MPISTHTNAARKVGLDQQRIFREDRNLLMALAIYARLSIEDPAQRAYVMVSGRVGVTTVDEDHQEMIVDEPAAGEFFGFASMLEQTPHQTTAVALEESGVQLESQTTITRLGVQLASQ